MPEPRYPLTVRLKGGRVNHKGREVVEGIYRTLCGKRGTSVPTSRDRGLCAACAARPEPIDCRSYSTGGQDHA
jgi:hypothetical protein